MPRIIFNASVADKHLRFKHHHPLDLRGITDALYCRVEFFTSSYTASPVPPVISMLIPARCSAVSVFDFLGLFFKSHATEAKRLDNTPFPAGNGRRGKNSKAEAVTIAAGAGRVGTDAHRFITERPVGVRLPVRPDITVITINTTVNKGVIVECPFTGFNKLTVIEVFEIVRCSRFRYQPVISGQTRC